jgi:hypothetical protein
VDSAEDGLRDIADPAERVRRASAMIDDLAATSGRVSAVRLEALAEMQASGMAQSEIARATGMTRARISQLMKAAPPAGQALLAPEPGPLTICVIEKREAERGRPSITSSTMTAAGKLTDLASSYDIRADIETIPAPGFIDLNRPNLAVLIGPRSSMLVAQAISADPVIKWRPDGHGDWYITDTRTETDYHSEFDSSWPGDRTPQTCYAHVGRIRRPDGDGSWLCLAGEHAPGVAGAVELFCRDVTSLWEQAHRSLWSAVAKVTVSETGAIEDASLISPVYVHGRK